MPACLENSAVATGLQKVSLHSNPKERQCQRMLKLPHIALISHASKVILKILQARFQQYMNHELPDVKAGFGKGRGTRSNCEHLLDHQKSKRDREKHVFLLYWLCQSLWVCGSQKNCGKFWHRWEYQTIWPASWETCMQVRKQQLELDMEQQTGSK